MKRQDNRGEVAFVLAVLLLLFSLLTLFPAAEARRSSFNVSARSAVLYCPENDTFLYRKNSSKRLPMASTTKIMTALLALESCSGDDIVLIGEESVGVEGSSAYLKVSEQLTMRELTYALLLQSANDAAVAIACHIGGSVEGFAALMNERAEKIGLQNTHFENPHGLDSEEHYTTAEDLAVLASVALENPDFKEICSTYKKSFITEERSRTYVNHNKLLKMYDGCIGVKTGYTKRCGRCLVGAAERDGLTFVTVTLDAPSDWADHKNMLDFGYDSLRKITLADEGEYEYTLPVLDGEVDSVTVRNRDALSIITENGECQIESHLRINRYAIAPISSSEILGEVIFTLDGKECGRLPLIADDDIKKAKEDGIFEKFISLFR